MKDLLVEDLLVVKLDAKAKFRMALALVYRMDNSAIPFKEAPQCINKIIKILDDVDDDILGPEEDACCTKRFAEFYGIFSFDICQFCVESSSLEEQEYLKEHLDRLDFIDDRLNIHVNSHECDLCFRQNPKYMLTTRAILDTYEYDRRTKKNTFKDVERELDNIQCINDL